ncbi:hypothetical protein [Enterococcus olivae]
MSIFKIIDGLFIGTRYGVLGMSILGVLASIVLFFVNISMGFSALMVFVATLALSLSLIVFLVPSSVMKGKYTNKRRYIVGGILSVLALGIMGFTYLSTGGFPELNLIFA